MQLFSDRGTPASWRFMNGYSAHTFKFTKADGKWVYMKLHFLTVSPLHYFHYYLATAFKR